LKKRYEDIKDLSLVDALEDSELVCPNCGSNSFYVECMEITTTSIFDGAWDGNVDFAGNFAIGYVECRECGHRLIDSIADMLEASERIQNEAWKRYKLELKETELAKSKPLVE